MTSLESIQNLLRESNYQQQWWFQPGAAHGRLDFWTGPRGDLLVQSWGQGESVEIFAPVAESVWPQLREWLTTGHLPPANDPPRGKIRLIRWVIVGDAFMPGNPMRQYEHQAEVPVVPRRGDSLQLAPGGKSYEVAGIEVAAHSGQITVVIEAVNQLDDDDFATECQEMEAAGWRCIEEHETTAPPADPAPTFSVKCQNCGKVEERQFSDDHVWCEFCQEGCSHEPDDDTPTTCFHCGKDDLEPSR